VVLAPQGCAWQGVASVFQQGRQQLRFSRRGAKALFFHLINAARTSAPGQPLNRGSQALRGPCSPFFSGCCPCTARKAGRIYQGGRIFRFIRPFFYGYSRKRAMLGKVSLWLILLVAPYGAAPQAGRLGFLNSREAALLNEGRGPET
jgi:hypothetical protein